MRFLKVCKPRNPAPGGAGFRVSYPTPRARLCNGAGRVLRVVRSLRERSSEPRSRSERTTLRTLTSERNKADTHKRVGLAWLPAVHEAEADALHEVAVRAELRLRADHTR